MGRGRKPNKTQTLDYNTIFYNSVGSYVGKINDLLSQTITPDPLSSHIKLIGGYAFKSANYLPEGIPIIRISDFSDEKIILKNVKFYKESDSLKQYELKSGDIIIALTGGTIAKLGIVQNGMGKLYLNQRVGKFEIINTSGFEKEYVYWIARSVQSTIKDLAWGAAIPNVSPKEIEKIKFPIPDKIIQRGIISFLNDLKSNCIKNICYFHEEIESEILFMHNRSLHSAGIKTELINQQTLLKKLRQQILQEAIEGKLTADWRKQNSPPLEGCPKGGVVKLRNTRNYLSLPYNPKLKQRARELRKAGNLSEVLFWNQIKRKQFLELDFDRQKIIGNYIVDFYCANAQVVIEIDGSSHDDKQDYDDQRNAYLEGLELTVIHLLDKDVKRNLVGVLSWLKRHPVFIEVGVVPEEEALLPADKTPPHPTGTPPEEGNWESAGELLARIKAEKDQLIKEKIKMIKSSPPITDEEKLFDLPDGWEWCRIDQILRNTRNALKAGPFGSSLTKSTYVESGYKVYGQEQVIKQDPTYGSYYVDENKYNELATCAVESGDMLLSLVGTIGKILILPEGIEKGIINPRLIKVTLHEQACKQYFCLLYSSLFVQRQLKKNASGQTMDVITIKNLTSLHLPFPPLLEQQAIIVKVEKLLALCDQLETQITNNQSHAEKLMQAVLKEAFQQNSTLEGGGV